MKTRLNKKSNTATIILNHSEVTDLWVALSEYKEGLEKDGFMNYAKVVDKQYRALLALAQKM